MKFSDVQEEQWEELRPYLDTCMLPVTGMNGEEQPYEATAALEGLRDVMDLIEIPFKGRVVTYPALHYVGAHAAVDMINDVCASLRASGFRYIIVATASGKLDLAHIQADLLLEPDQAGELPSGADVKERVSLMWNPKEPS
ncbi:hypothetical protein BBD42_22225 [Paenibacillus sp. BIHB 4019]|uniref:DUF2487 domain-containing protein n=1 Tax=Paenibacillus sp. BIHB 4019 TaxID=1870819 RepID=A0A1B2DMH0_9BACL|nr:DUF2487 family protein [Paenibacillus sp. BIHB 4019]ANY68891.1 hypothetical protein BBD42_22225 [Paenibacillus sp. BIHB 4019]